MERKFNSFSLEEQVRIQGETSIDVLERMLRDDRPQARAQAGLSIRAHHRGIAGHLISLALAAETNEAVKRAHVATIALLTKREAKNWLSAIAVTSADTTVSYYALHHLHLQRIRVNWVARSLLHDSRMAVLFLAICMLAGETETAINAIERFENMARVCKDWQSDNSGPGDFYKGKEYVLKKLDDLRQKHL